MEHRNEFTCCDGLYWDHPPPDVRAVYTSRLTSTGEMQQPWEIGANPFPDLLVDPE